jgi:hypothetical protein
MSYSQNLGRIPFDKYYQPSLLSPPTSAPGAIAPSRLPVDELSLERLTAIAAWIRDHLDPRVAREGPEILHPDDVLLLLDVFTALQHVEISASTLRVTRIYKAILEVSGKATRWPGRLADECDKLIILWRHHFGPLKGLRPFLYGRGGRLDGTTNVTDVTKGVSVALLRDTHHYLANIFARLFLNDGRRLCQISSRLRGQGGTEIWGSSPASKSMSGHIQSTTG